MAREFPARAARKAVTKAELQLDKLDRLAEHLEAIEVWTRNEGKGRRPRLTRDDIAAAAVRIADREGFVALSMRRLAAELDVGTMSLYHYVRTKEELLTLVLDAIMVEVLVPANQLEGPWREALLSIATRSRDALLRHPWVLDISDDPPIGPNAMRHFDQTLQAVSGFAAPFDVKLELMLAVDEYVFGYCVHARNHLDRDHFDDESVRTYMSGLVDGGDYPALADMIRRDGFDHTWDRISAKMRDATRFERNLTRLLDGFEARR